ncbi:MAG: endonuclease [Clostridia bacterium]|nr:endonuclease [Clostridia bacterium]
MKRQNNVKSFSLVLVMVLCFATLLSVIPFSNTVVASAASDSYYAGITATSGKQLLGQIHDLITKTHTKYTSYNDCKNTTIIKTTDAGSKSGYVMEFYSQADIAGTWGSGNQGTWNREHVWPQSLSNGMWGQSNGGSDLHHIRPVETGLNSARGNNKFDEVSGGKAVYYEDSNNKNVAIGGYVASGEFEPLDFVKGDVARIVMYVYTHYNTYSNVGGTTNGSGGEFGTLKFSNVIGAGSEDACIDLLLKWNREDPVDDIERNRNDAVYKIQGNRNPFIDHPEYADKIWGKSTIAVTSIALSSTSLALKVGGTQTLTVTANPAGASNAVKWTTSNSSVATVSNGKVTAVGKGTATITATSTENANVKATATVTVSTIAPTSITLSNSNVALSVGDTEQITVKVSPTNAVSTVTWSTSDSSVATVSNGKVTAVGKGTATITATSTENANIKATATVTVKQLESIQITGSLTKTSYLLGDKIDCGGVTAKAIYSDSSQVDITQQVEWETNDNSSSVTKNSTSIGFTYGGKWYDAGAIKVIWSVGIVVEGTADKTVYFPNQTFNPTGLSVKLVYSDDSTQAVSLVDCTWVDKETNSATLTGETTQIVCKYNGFVSEPIQVKVIYPVGIVVEGTADKTVYFPNQTFDPTGLSVKLVYSDNSTESIEFEDCSWVDKATGSTIISLDTTEIVCKYQTYTSDPIQITVDYKLVNITITGVSTTQYIEGEKFNPNGLTITASFSDGTTQNIELSSCTWTDTATQSDVLTLQTTSVSCTYNGITVKVCDVTVTRNPAIVHFENAVANVTAAQGLQNKFTAIGQALDAYNALTQEEKDAVASLYNTLQAEITAYNTQANKNNQDISSAVETVVISLSKVLIVLFALLAVLGIYKR